MEKIARALLIFLVAASASAQVEERITVEFPPSDPQVGDQREDFSVTAGGVVVWFQDGFRSWLKFSSVGPTFGAYGSSDRMQHWGMSVTFSEPVKDIRFYFQFDEFFSDFSVNGSSIRSLRQPGPSRENIFYAPTTTRLDFRPFVVTSWGFYAKVGLFSFARANLDRDTVPTQAIRAPQRPPDASDLRVVADSLPGLDTRCSYRSEGPLAIDIPVRRVVGPVDASGKLMNPQPLIGGGYLSKTAKLTLMAYDIDPQEIDRVYFNAQLLGNLKGGNNQWSQNTFTVPVESLRFGRNAVGVNFEGLNTIRIEIDQVGDPPKWCTSVDWATLEFDAIAPVFLVHGTNSGPRTWEDGIVEYLDSVGIPFSNDIQLEKNGTIALNGELLADRVRALARAFGAKECHLVAHSKGGNDSREFLARHHDVNYAKNVKVLSLYTLSTPFKGTVIADIISEARVPANRGRDSNNPYIRELISRDYFFLNTPCCEALRDNTTAEMRNYNLARPFPDGFKFYNFAADADLNDDRRISFEERTPLFPDLLIGAFNNMVTVSAEASYLALATIGKVKIDYRIIRDSTGYPVARIPMIEVDEVTQAFHENDLVVTVQSAQHEKALYLGQLDANHSTLKSAAVMQGILSRIKADFSVQEPK